MAKFIVAVTTVKEGLLTTIPIVFEEQNFQIASQVFVNLTVQDTNDNVSMSVADDKMVGIYEMNNKQKFRDMQQQLAEQHAAQERAAKFSGRA